MNSLFLSLFVAIVVAALLSACSGDVEEEPVQTQKDVYRSLEDCISDWADKEMCVQAMNAQTQIQVAQANASAAIAEQRDSGAPVIIPMFFGPEYDVNNRVAYSKSGTIIQPKGKHYFKQSPKLTPSSVYKERRSSFSKRPSTTKKVESNSWLSRKKDSSSYNSSRSSSRSYTRSYSRRR